MFLKKCWSMIDRSFYPLLNDLVKTNHCLSRVPFTNQHNESSLPNFKNTTRYYSTSIRASPPLSSTNVSQLSSPYPTQKQSMN